MASEAAPGLGLSFTDFLAKMKEPAAADLVRHIKSFIRGFEDRPPGHAVDPEADSSQVQAFLSQSEQHFRQHPVWRSCQPEVLDQAVEGLEKYVMSKVWRQTFGAWQEDRERDERYRRLMQALGFVDLPTLMGVQVEPDPNMLALAQGELLKMDRYKAPRDKLLCLVNVKTMVENIVQLAARGGASIGGADAFFPVFLFVVIRSRLPHLASNVEYVKRFRSRARLSGQFDFMLCNLESAAMYLDTVNYEHLAVSQEQFLGHLAAAGIPEAHLELRRMQQAAAAGEEAAAAGVPEARGSDGGVAWSAGGEGGGTAAAEGGADVADVLAGLQLLDEGAAGAAGADDSDGRGGEGLPAASPAATPADAALLEGGAAAADGGGSRSLTPLSEPETAAPPPAEAAADQADDDALARVPRELLFEPADQPAAQQWQQQVVQPYVEPRLIEEMVADGTRLVLAAEAAGQLQQRYPYMYAQVDDLAVTDVQAVLVGYKELLLRYEALSRALQQQLGGGGAAAAGAGAAAHRSKLKQQLHGFGSLISAGLEVPGGLGGADADAAGSRDASPGKWSPGGILQRIASRGPRRSLTPPRDGDSSAAAAAAAMEADGTLPAQQEPEGSRRPLLRRLSPGKQGGQNAFFSTLFGSSSSSNSSPKLPPMATQRPQAGPQQPVAASGLVDGGGTPEAGTPSSPPLQLPSDGEEGAGPDPSFAAEPAPQPEPQLAPSEAAGGGLLATGADPPAGAPAGIASVGAQPQRALISFEGDAAQGPAATADLLQPTRSDSEADEAPQPLAGHEPAGAGDQAPDGEEGRVQPGLAAAPAAGTAAQPAMDLLS